jgi:hypothetical protein
MGRGRKARGRPPRRMGTRASALCGSRERERRWQGRCRRARSPPAVLPGVDPAVVGAPARLDRQEGALHMRRAVARHGAREIAEREAVDLRKPLLLLARRAVPDRNRPPLLLLPYPAAGSLVTLGAAARRSLSLASSSAREEEPAAQPRPLRLVPAGSRTADPVPWLSRGLLLPDGAERGMGRVLAGRSSRRRERLPRRALAPRRGPVEEAAVWVPRPPPPVSRRLRRPSFQRLRLRLRHRCRRRRARSTGLGP